MSDTYNGWTNYETWNLALWIDNDEGSQRHWRDRAEEVYRDTDKGDDRRNEAACELYRELQADTEENAPALDGFYGDILGAAISEVNWYEIAKHWIDDVADEIDKEEADEEAELLDTHEADE